MDRNRTNHRPSFEAPGPQARELTEAELDIVSGGCEAAANYKTVTLACRKAGTDRD